MSENILSNIILDVKTKSLAQFELKYTGWYLYGNPVADDSSAIQYQTDVIKPSDFRKLLAQSQNANTTLPTSDAMSSEHFVMEIKKKPSSAFTGWITIGRAVNNDIVLRYPTVSKLHARLEIETTAFGDPIGFQLVDNNSTGKTVFNGQMLEPNQVVPISIGDTILFGSITTIIVDASTLWNKLQ